MSFLLIFITIELAAITAALFIIQTLRSVAQKPESGKAFAWAAVVGAVAGLFFYPTTHKPSSGLAYTITGGLNQKHYFGDNQYGNKGEVDDYGSSIASGFQTIDVEEGYGTTSYMFMYRLDNYGADRFILDKSLFENGSNQYKHDNDYFIHAVWPIKTEYLNWVEHPKDNVKGETAPTIPSGIVPMDDVVNGENFVPPYAATMD